MCLLIVCETMFTMGDSRVISSSKHKWLEILTREDFPPKLLSSDNGFLKLNADNEEETSQQREHRLANRRQLRQQEAETCTCSFSEASTKYRTHNANEAN